ncbi:MAG: rRNA maturation RNase YbeY [Candidatus Omnitrophica bacterium]|nr:rRNA maturation RNase YbeY [Candidatus Omnitrophota bacterium]HOX55026.1 rRNA maturation RNase YbeY [Candidatus Omnitrophota bacterium]
MKLRIINLQNKIPIPKKKILSKTKKILKLQNKVAANLSVVFVNDHLIKKLNKKFLRKNRPTDVMAFDLKDKNEHTSSINGEIVISTETAVRNSKIYKTKQYDELLLYVIHGVLHLCGFNDHKKQETKLMRKREQYILQKIS